MFTGKEDHQPQEDFYTCRKCGTLLFLKPDVLHENLSTSSPDSSDTSTARPSPSVSNVKMAWGCVDSSQRAPICSSVFITDPPPWMSNATSHDGRMNCPKCKCRVGSFSWSGVTCSCGRWVTPAFQFQLSRIDSRKAVSSASLPDLRVAQPIDQSLPSKSHR